MISFYASLSHYLAHILPIWHALPEARRGPIWSPRRDVLAQARLMGVPEAQTVRGRPRRSGLYVVASAADQAALRPSPVVLVQHGAGQSYGGDPRSAGNAAYSGGSGRDNVVMHICPGESDAAVCRASQPDVPAVAVGCPAMDGYLSGTYKARIGALSVPPVVAFSYHWPCRIAPEAGWAWPHWADAVAALARTGRYQVLGHAHPRAWGRLERWYREVGIEPVRSFSEVLLRADLYVADNSSTLPEFASTGRPVALMDAPWYRADVHHGGRFWDWADMGVRSGDPADLPDMIARALADPPDVRESRVRVVSEVYSGGMDGHASERAAAAIIDVADRMGGS